MRDEEKRKKLTSFVVPPHLNPITMKPDIIGEN
jgi:hypothetical protein